MIRGRKSKIAVVCVLIVAISALAGPYIYSWFERAPDTLVSRRLINDTTIFSADLNGDWKVAEGSVVGYRVKEQIVLTKLESVGRTESVTGIFSVQDGILSSARFEVDVSTITSDRSQRDGQFRTRIMDVAKYPTATFTLTKSIALPLSSEVASMRAFTISGELQLRDATRFVKIDIFAAVDAGRLRITGSTEIRFSEWGIPNPSVPEVFIFTDPFGILEFDLLFTPLD